MWGKKSNCGLDSGDPEFKKARTVSNFMKKLSCGLESGDPEFKKGRTVSNFMHKFSCGFSFGDLGLPELKREINFRVELLTVTAF